MLKDFKDKQREDFKAARESLWEYCKMVQPKFFKEDRTHLKEICDTMQGIYERKLINPKTNKPYKGMMLNVPPRHGKSFTAALFSQWVLGKNNENRLITVSYNETLSGRFAKNVRDGISETSLDKKKVVFNDVFPSTHIKYGDAAASMWALEGQFFNYLATSFGATVTGIGCNIGIIDDPVKSHIEAFNDARLEEHYEWYANTFLSRIEEGGIQIIIMTRWSTKDLCGRLLEEEGDEWCVLELKACIDEQKGIMLCQELLSFESYQDKKKKVRSEIFLSNYQQQPVDVKGKLYTTLKTYKAEDSGQFERIMAYVDTADTGADYLCCIVAGIFEGEAFVLDVYYTDEPMEVTEPKTAEVLYINNTNIAFIESNNGGRGFARSVEGRLWKKYKTKKVVLKKFHQTQNKVSRIISNSTFVMEHIYFPVNWHNRWPEFYKAITTYKAKGKNEHDDAADALTGVAEHLDKKSGKLGTINRKLLSHI